MSKKLGYAVSEAVLAVTIPKSEHCERERIQVKI